MQRKEVFLSIFLIGALLAACGGGGSSSNPVGPAQDITPTPTPTPAFVGGVGNVPPGDFTIELEMIYSLLTVVGTDQALTYTTTILLQPEIKEDNRNARGEGEILEDITFQIKDVTCHNVADWGIEVDVTYEPSLGEKPLLLDFVFTGEGYSSVKDVELGTHMMVDTPVHTYQLTLPLIDGATESFGIEGWRDFKEWTVVLHLK